MYYFLVPGNLHSGVSGNDSIMATGVFSASELLRVTRRKFLLNSVQLVQQSEDNFSLQNCFSSNVLKYPNVTYVF